jgi:hypothetical protein
VAAFFEQRGCEIIVTEPRLRPTYKERANYGDQFDVLADGARFETKWRGVDFTSRQDFPYKTAFVDRATKPPRAALAHCYCSVNKSMTHIALICTETKASWLVKTIWDKVKGYHPLEVFECPLALINFIEIEPIAE